MAKQTLRDKKVYPAWDIEVIDNKVRFKERESFDKHLIPLEGKENLQLVIKRKVKKRSRKVENYYHYVVCGFIGNEMSLTHGEVHEFLKELFLKEEKRIKLNDGRVVRYARIMSTTELSDKRYEEFVFDQVLPWASKPTIESEGLHENSGLSLYIPLPNEVDWDGRDEYFN